MDTTLTAATADPSRSATAALPLRAIRWVGWSLPALPVAVLLHEAAHFLLYWAFGFSGVRLHYAAVSHDVHLRFFTLLRAGEHEAAAALAPYWQVGIASGSAILVSYLTILGAAYLTWKNPPHPFIVAVGLVATLRFQIGLTILSSQLIRGERFVSGTDEGLTAAVLGLPEVALWLVGVSIAIVGWVVILRGLTPGRRLKQFGLVVLGAVLGGALYVVWLGPWLLPATRG